MPPKSKKQKVDHEDQFASDATRLRQAIDRYDVDAMKPLIKSLKANPKPGYMRNFTDEMIMAFDRCAEWDFFCGAKLVRPHLRDFTPRFRVAVQHAAYDLVTNFVSEVSQADIESALCSLPPRRCLIRWDAGPEFAPMMESDSEEPFPLEKFRIRDMLMCSVVEVLLTSYTGDPAKVASTVFEYINDEDRIVWLWRHGVISREKFLRLHPLFAAYIDFAAR